MFLSKLNPKRWPTAFRKVAGVVGPVAPTIAAALVPGGGVVAELARGALATAVGKPADTPAGALLSHVSALSDPDAWLKVKAADDAFAAQMQQMGVQLEALNTQDRASARAMQIATRSWIPGFLVIISTFMVGALMYTLATRAIPGGNENVLVNDTGLIVAAWVAEIYFYFGNSSNSARQNEIIAQQAAKAHDTIAALKTGK